VATVASPRHRQTGSFPKCAAHVYHHRAGQAELEAAVLRLVRPRRVFVPGCSGPGRPRCLVRARQATSAGSDVLVANAGGGSGVRPWVAITRKGRRHSRGHVKGVSLHVQKALPLLGAGACIILTGSTNSITGGASLKPLLGAKAAVRELLARSWIIDLKGRTSASMSLSQGPPSARAPRSCAAGTPEGAPPMNFASVIRLVASAPRRDAKAQSSWLPRVELRQRSRAVRGRRARPNLKGTGIRAVKAHGRRRSDHMFRHSAVATCVSPVFRACESQRRRRPEPRVSARYRVRVAEAIDLRTLPSVPPEGSELQRRAGRTREPSMRNRRADSRVRQHRPGRVRRGLGLARRSCSTRLSWRAVVRGWSEQFDPVQPI